MNPPSLGEPASTVVSVESRELGAQKAPGVRSLKTLFSAAICFGVIAGIGEGIGLLLFQRINWAQWARMMHVSKEILWISPAVDLCFYLLISVAVAFIAKMFRRLPALRVLQFVLIFLTAYDWLMLTGHFYRRAALLFALGVAVACDRWLRKHQPRAEVISRRSAPWLLATLAVLAIGIEGGKRIGELRAVSNL